MDLEAIIKEKDFIELTVQERELVGEIASNEEEYNTLKSFLLATESAIAEDKIVASDAMRQHVMDELYAPVSSKKTWFSSFFSFLFPENTPVFRYPAFQLSLIVLLFFGFFFMMDNPFKNEELALNDKVVEQTDEKVRPVEEKVKDEKVAENEMEKIPVEDEAITDDILEPLAESIVVEDDIMEVQVMEDLADADISMDVEAEVEEEIINERFMADEAVPTVASPEITNYTNTNSAFLNEVDFAPATATELNTDLENITVTIDENSKKLKDKLSEEAEQIEEVNETEKYGKNDDVVVAKESFKQKREENKVVAINASKKAPVFDYAYRILKITIKQSSELNDLFYEVK